MPVDRDMGRCGDTGHLHYECTACGYRGTVNPTSEECRWIAEQLQLRASGKPSQLPG